MRSEIFLVSGELRRMTWFAAETLGARIKTSLALTRARIRRAMARG